AHPQPVPADLSTCGSCSCRRAREVAGGAHQRDAMMGYNARNTDLEPDPVSEAIADAKSRIAWNVRRMREARGWSQLELAARAGLNRNSVQNVEQEKRLTLGSMCAIAVAFGVD